MVGKFFGKAFRILGLDERKGRWVVTQDFHGNFSGYGHWFKGEWVNWTNKAPRFQPYIIDLEFHESQQQILKLRYVTIFNPCAVPAESWMYFQQTMKKELMAAP